VFPSLLFCKTFSDIWYKFFLKCLVEFTTWVWNFISKEVLNYSFRGFLFVLFCFNYRAIHIFFVRFGKFHFSRNCQFYLSCQIFGNLLLNLLIPLPFPFNAKSIGISPLTVFLYIVFPLFLDQFYRGLSVLIIFSNIPLWLCWFSLFICFLFHWFLLLSFFFSFFGFFVVVVVIFSY